MVRTVAITVAIATVIARTSQRDVPTETDTSNAVDSSEDRAGKRAFGFFADPVTIVKRVLLPHTRVRLEFSSISEEDQPMNSAG